MKLPRISDYRSRVCIFRVSHETKNLKYPCVKIKYFVEVKIKIYVIKIPLKKY